MAELFSSPVATNWAGGLGKTDLKAVQMINATLMPE